VQQMRALLENSVTGDEAVRVARHVKHFHARLQGREPLCQHASVDSGHDDIREQ
jgi:hypothetical protein